jgi:hypothetical protein
VGRPGMFDLKRSLWRDPGVGWQGRRERASLDPPWGAGGLPRRRTSARRHPGAASWGRTFPGGPPAASKPMLRVDEAGADGQYVRNSPAATVSSGMDRN